MYIVIRAGGVGARLWPISRQAKPKQLHALTSSKTMLQEAIDRVQDFEPAEHVFISCNQRALENITNQTNWRKANMIVEPHMRDTAAAVGLETIMIAQRDPQAIVASLGSDHAIANTAEFQRVLKLAEQTIQQQPDQLVCIGVKPTCPDTGYGYIELASEIAPETFRVKSFKEKPDATTAEQFLQAGNYLWNANMFVWRVDTLLQLYEQHMPKMYEQLMYLKDHMDEIDQVYPELERIAIDYAIIERTKNLLAIPGDFGWNDIGDWSRLHDQLASQTYTNGDHVVVDTNRSLIFSETKRLIATIGVDDLIIVDTPDALLVCHKSRSQDVKQIVDHLKQHNREDML